ncbi:PRC-barrel domain-containing protein [Alkalihalobacillus sp. 1P02AB]|uniref:PRC-barrel domain-containing protein n=1 Tax=Alkalihalobacillus sp. 1P02AB TaxID=3132260 RepID=UPI0039A6125F
MRTFSTLEGLPVIDVGSGNEFGAVLDLICDEGRVSSIVIDKRGWLNRHYLIPIEEIHSIGNDGIMVTDLQKLHHYTDAEKHRLHLKHGKHQFRGKLLLSTEGEKLGLVEDVYFNEELGTITGYEVTDGLLSDLIEGRKVIRGGGKLVVGKEKAILSI